MTLLAFVDTRREAHREILPHKTSMQWWILDRIRCRSNFGMTCDEIEENLKMRHQTVSARLRELAQQGKITDSGRRRKTRSGRNAIVWCLT